ncbi:uncharacterized protein CDAR_306371 [Caerostris darwini]|uniref:DUF3752 domain-containing protein n=1 Tax=Caerostris darwini TaxID=1538125 RepID=A0AAV4SSF1_9ARAC|nr:uncharacterized protein CDAR_306371 [Caerostris darwini]
MDLYGPALPPGYVRSDDEDSNESADDSSEKKSPKVIGPQIPDFLSKDMLSNIEESKSSRGVKSQSTNVIGPALPPSLQNKSDDDDSEGETYGPLPMQCDNDSYDLHEKRAAIEKRSSNMRNKLDNKHLPTVETLEREEWMVVPDTTRKNQLGAISRCLAPAKSSSKEKHHHKHSKEDKKTTEELKKYNKSKRSESLLEMHEKSRKKKAKEKEKMPKERKAFDRDEIAVKHFSKDQVNSVVDKAKYLNSRFSAGSNQYL